MAANRRKVQYEIRINGKWRPVPEGSRLTPLKSGAMLVSGTHQDGGGYFDKDEWRIVTAHNKEDSTNGR